MKENLKLQPELDGKIWLHVFSGRFHFLHRHDELESNLIVQGAARYIVGDRRYDLSRNTQIWLFPEQEHVLLDASPDFSMYILVYKTPMVKRLCRDPRYKTLLKGDPGYFCKPIAEHQAARLRRLYDELCEVELQADPARFNSGLGYAMHSSWAAQQADENITPSFDIHPAVERAARLIHNETEPIGIEQLGAQAGLSASRLSRLFKAQTGVSLVDYRNKQRMKRFVALYGQGRRISMMQAALASGFGSYPQFHRVFKNLMGCSPAAYRKKVQLA